METPYNENAGALLRLRGILVLAGALSSADEYIAEPVNVAYLYMSTTTAVLYSLLWTWVDLDVRRMQPWLELSWFHGAYAAQSLSLSYRFEFLAFVPIKAWKQKALACIHTKLNDDAYFLGDHTGAVFGQQSVTVSRSLDMTTSSSLIPLEEQANLIDVSILNSAYGTTCKFTFFILSVFHFYSPQPHLEQRKRNALVLIAALANRFLS